MKTTIENNVKKGFKTIKNYYETEQTIKKMRDELTYFWKDRRDFDNDEKYLEYKEEYKQKEKKLKKLQSKNEINKNIVDVIKNNLKIKVIEILKTEVFENLKKYAGKNIGEKTSEKIKTEVEEYFEKEYNLIVSFYFYHRETYSKTKEISIKISIAESYTIEKSYYGKEYKSFKNFLSIGNDKEIELIVYTLNSPEDLGAYEKIEDYTEYKNVYYKVIDYINDLEYIDIEKIDPYAKKLITEKEKAIARIEKLQKEIEKTKNSFNHSDFTKGFLHNNYIQIR